MGVYNPHTPQILGQEWVGIREEDMTFSPAVNVVEVGHGFTTLASYTLQDARFYINDWPPGRALGQVYMANIYPAGKEAETGPVRTVTIPCNNAYPSGGAVVNGGGTAADAVADPSDNQYLAFPRAGSGGLGASIRLNFATNSYQNELSGKRIVGVNLLYTLAANSGILGTAPIEADLGAFYIERATVGSLDISLGLGQASGSLVGNPEIFVARAGEIDAYWTALSPTIPERMPWTYTGLQKFEITSAGRISIVYHHDLNATWDGVMSYAALQILFCEENRLYCGGRAFGESGAPGFNARYVMGANTIPIRDLAYNANPVLAAGNYTLVVESADLGDSATAVVNRKINLSLYPDLNGMRQLYAMTPHPGVQINVTQTPGEEFSKEEVQILPQLTLHTSGGPINEVHVYGRQAAAQVYGTVTATQEILDSAALAARPYPWVRFYARRFGDTTVPLRLDSTTITGAGVNAEITPIAFDALDEIVDGWKEVTLRFTTAPSMGAGTTPQWRWSATGELIGNRWEVLGVIAPALSGITGNLKNLVPSPQQLSAATYGQPAAGATVNLGWVPGYAPAVTATTDDQTADAVLMFALDMPTITGFAAANASQTVVGVGLDCGLNPCCVPSAIKYTRLTWGLPPNTGAFSDQFTRTVAAGSWGGTYTLFGTATDYSVNGTQGVVTFSAVNSSRFATVSAGAIDFDVKAEFTLNSLVLTGTMRAGVVGRFTAATDNYLASVDVGPTGAITLQIEKRVLGVATTLGSVSLWSVAGGPDANVTVRLTGYGQFLKAKAWRTGYDEPSIWDIEVTDTSLTTGSGAGIFVRDNSAVVGHTVAVDNLVITPPQYWFGHYELQRMDTVTTDWQTIMSATNPATSGFNDFEARVGVLSSYRIRSVDAYDFAGPWSATVTATVPSPGVTIGCTGGHLLIFTSNEEQDGSLNLAYSSVWEGNVEEAFSFPEANFVEMQAMYNRDFFTAFRPTERGGEQFSRTVLVQAAAISPQSLADFTGLRDMAWANVSYICVRDEDGNRWFTTVLVPSGRVLRDRRLYMAPVNIIEVTDTPSEVDP
jgi:hypothetical protein